MENVQVEELSVSLCWALLRTVEVGRIATPTASGRVEIFPVNHIVDHGSVVFRTGPGTKLTAAIEAVEVAFEADNAAPGAEYHVRRRDDPWSVVIHGTAELITLDTELLDSFDLSVRPWHAATKPYFVRIVPNDVTGRRIRLDADRRDDRARQTKVEVEGDDE